ncbi:PTS sugar transporter subunit IIA [Sodalis praecaptivus]|uniref:PTS sugar transporter subunit IIA n=2 Tax=Bruguierivoracaceae TaxID=2812006 RepID=W0I062_9GAMM|nr:PTS sugar transporter subunit IIA [Sodalis praecaptivus]
MTAKEKIYQNIVARYAHHHAGFTAQDCAQFLVVNRSVISHYLNRLCEDGKLCKHPGRPVRFYIAAADGCAVTAMPPRRQDVFSKLIGDEGSLREQVALCRSAVDYPSGGLPLLLVGESGVGKSFVAGIIHRYAQERGVIKPDKALIELNCADYANNPELLSAMLFGYIKGAFTGADREKNGLLDEAHDGFLFLDEVHRLSAENQEKLFLFMDKGYFHRLGDNRVKHPAHIRFIFATTENTDHVLLNTFRRRIPIKVELPNFASRPLTERVALVEDFFLREAQCLEQNITLSTALLNQLVTSPIRGNIGELKNQIKVLCATAWSESAPGQTLIVNSASPCEPLSRDDTTTFHWQTEGRTGLTVSALLPKAMTDDVIFQEFCHSGNVLLLIRKLEHRLSAISGILPHPQWYAGYLWQKVTYAVDELEELSGQEIGQDGRKAIYLCLNYALHQQSDAATLEQLNDITDYVAQKARMLAQETIRLLHQHVTEQPLPLLMPLLGTVFTRQVGDDDVIQGIIVAHGRATATSIAGIANKLSGGFYLKAFDMPYSVSTRAIIDRLIDHLNNFTTRGGLIILVDMGSLKEIYQEIKLHLHCELLVVNNVSTAMALDIAGKIQHRVPMKAIIEGLQGAYEIEARYYQGLLPGNKIIISCISGEGIAKKLKDIVQRYLAGENIEIITLEYDDLKWKIAHDAQALNGTRLIITTTDLEAGYLPSLSVHQLVKEKASVLRQKYFTDLVSPTALEPMIDEVVKLFTVEGVAGRLNFLNPSVVIDEVEAVIKQYESFYKRHFESYLRMNLFMHIALMIERLMVNAGMDNRDQATLTEPQHQFVALQPTFYQALVRKYHIALPLTEMLMVYEIMEPWIDPD